MLGHARAVVVGGGCVGAGVLYALAKKGWSDIALLERTQLTAGSTWHAAGLIPGYTRSRNVGMMIAKTISIYESLQEDTGQNPGWHKCGQLRVAKTRDRWDEFKSYMSLAEVQGVRAELVTRDQIKALVPIWHDNCTALGGLYHPDEGHIAPADVTQAMAAGARQRGAKIYLNTEVTGFERLPSGDWKVKTNKGDIVCEHVILATGNYARQTGAMLGLDIPTTPILHQYWTTEPVPEIVERKKSKLPEMPIFRDEEYEGYLREEGDGLMFGPYERTEHVKLFAEDGVPAGFGADLLPEDFEAVSRNWERAVELVPALGRAGIKKNVRGPIQMTADELPLVGSAWGLQNVWLAEGVPGGILWGGAIGHYLAERIIDGGCSIDTSELDPRRFGDYANKRWIRDRAIECWGTHGVQHYPGEEMTSGRKQKMAPSYDILDKLGAVWGMLNGWEVPNWFAPTEEQRTTKYDSWRWTPRGEFVGAEVAAVRNAVGVVEMTPMTKFEVSGPGATRWLDRVLANRIPRVGRINLSHNLTRRGGVQAEYTVARLGEDHYYLISTPRAERWNLDDLTRLLPADGSVTLRNVTNERGCLTVVGPKARDVLQQLTQIDLGNERFPWFAVRSGTVDFASDVRMFRVNYEGELGWELYHPIGYQRSLLTAILEAGAAHGIRPIGFYALESLRLEKSYRAMFRDMNPELTAWESSLDRFIDLKKPDFIGKEALLAQQRAGIPRRTVTIKVATDDASLVMHEGIYHQGKLVGRVTSGGYSYTYGYDLAIALLPKELCAVGTKLTVPILGEHREAEVIAESPYDPTGSRGRM